MYSCTSVCSWLLMRTHLKPQRAAKYSTIEVLPILVGPCKTILMQKYTNEIGGMQMSDSLTMTADIQIFKNSLKK